VHALFQVDPELPVPPGEGPFHTRGAVYRRMLEHAVIAPGGIDAFHRALGEESVIAFAKQKFSLLGWYDVFPIIPISMALAAVHAVPFEQRIFERARLAAVQMIPSVFRVLIALTKPAAMAGRLPIVLEQQYDFGTVAKLKTTATGGTGTVSCVPAYVAPYLANLYAGFIVGALDLAKAKNAAAAYTDVRPDVELKGYPTLAIDFEVAWSE
jgi:hypothetical protein